MRISSRHFGDTMIWTLHASSSKAAELMQKIGNGRRIQRPSDDPIGAVRLMQLERDASRIGQYLKNIDTLSVKLARNEAHLDGMLQTVMSARDVLIAAADGGRSPDDLNALAGSLRSLKDALAQAANAKDDNGHYLFGGTLTGTPPIAFDAEAPAGNRYRFVGNVEQQHVVIGDGVTQAANVAVDNLMRVLNGLDAVAETLADPSVDGGAPNTRALLSDTLHMLDVDGVNALGEKIAMLGNAQNTLALLSNNHAAMLVTNDQANILVGELDFAAAVEELNRYVMAVQGTYQAYGKIRQLSLFDVI